MTAKGHILLALAPAIAVSSNIEATNQLFFLGAVALGALIPDIDEPNSYIGRKASFLSIPLKILGIKHRTFTHYFIFPFMLFFIALFLNGIYQTILLGLAFGIAMHDVGDMLTKGGIKGFLYPFYKDKTIHLLPKQLRFYTNSLVEKVFILLLFILNIFLIFIQYKNIILSLI